MLRNSTALSPLDKIATAAQRARISKLFRSY
jgi:hypothetical protein